MMGPISIVVMPVAQELQRSGDTQKSLYKPILPAPASVVLAVCPELRAHRAHRATREVLTHRIHLPDAMRFWEPESE